MKQIDKSVLQFTLVVDDDKRVLGTLTDGDIRRALMNGGNVNSQIDEFTNKNFIYFLEGENLNHIESKMNEKMVSHIPILNPCKKAVGLFIRNYKREKIDNRTPVFILAGGLGTRLRPLTNDFPKPLIEIGGRPILEHIIKDLSHQGFKNFLLSINFQGKLIKDYFGDGRKWNVSIQYIEEKKRLGTAGSLSLLQETNFEDLLVMNADLLTKLNFKNLLDHHKHIGADVTICSRPYLHQVPFGVLSLEGSKVIEIKEKPLISQMISAGIYVLKKRCIEFLEYEKYCDMPDLLHKALSQNCLVTNFEITDDWVDIGRLNDLEQARNSFQTTDVSSLKE